MPVLFEQLQEFNRDVKHWGRNTRQALAQKLMSLNLRERIKLAGEISLRASVKDRYRTLEGQVEGVKFSFARHGIFLERGVGRGVPVAKVSTSARTPKPWLSAILPGKVEKLADLVARHYGDEMAEEVKIIIPGVINTKIKI